MFTVKYDPSSSLKLAGGAEIFGYSSARKVALVIGGAKTLSLVGLDSFDAPALVSALTLDADAQSVAIAGDLVAVAKQHITDKAQPGQVEFFRLSGVGVKATLTSLGSVTVGSVPDSVAFNDAGTKLVVANEGEVIDSTTTDAVGSVSIIDTSSFGDATTSASGFPVTSVVFDAYASQKVKLENLGIRISAGSTGASVMQNLEPEAIAIAGEKAYISLQENNAVAEVDIATSTIVDIWSLGVKDWLRGAPAGKDFTFTVTYPGTAPAGLIAGGLSGLFYAGKEDNNEVYYTLTDRGPQPANIGDRLNDNPSDPNSGQKIFDDPAFAPTVYKLAKDVTTGAYSVANTITLKVPDGSGSFRSATGIGQISAKDDKAFRLKTAGNGIAGDPNRYNQYEQVAWDAFGIDPESINVFTKVGLNDGKPVIAVSDEYGPQIAIFDAGSGNLIKRFVPSTRDYTADVYQAGRSEVAAFTGKTLPSVYADRNANRGFEGMAFNSDDGLLYAFVQSPLRPTGYNNQELIRILAIDPSTGAPAAEYFSLLPVEAGQDKIGDAVYDPSRKAFLVIERDSDPGVTSNKSIAEINLLGATNTLDYTLNRNGKSWTTELGVAQPELATTASMADLLAAKSIFLAKRTELINIPSVGGNPLFDKPEGLALGPNGKLVVGYDNDFLAVSGRPANVLTEITFTPTPVDTSDLAEAGGALGVKNLYGLPMADGLDTFKVNGKTFIIVAGEGDDREGVVTGNISINDATRVSSTTYANKSALQSALGDRLKLVNTEGDYNEDNTLDQPYAFGSRSFRIYDEAQNLIFDSGNQLDEIAKALGVYDDTRSDDKGTEPEMVDVQTINGRNYAFVGLERTKEASTAGSAAISVWDVTNPYAPAYVTAFVSSGSYSPEGVRFVSTDPSGAGYLMVANEVTGHLEFYRFGDVLASSSPNEFSGRDDEMMLPFSGSYLGAGSATNALFTIGTSQGSEITGVPDGQGAYRVDGNTIRLLLNSEIGNTGGFTYTLSNGTQLTGARISYVDLNNAGQVKGGGLAYDTVYDRAGKVVTSESQVRGPGVTAGGFNRFCSANLVEKDTFGTGKGAADRMFLLGEEFTDGTMWILDVDQGDLWAAPAMGYGSWETATMVDTGNTSQVAYLLGDDGPGEKGAAIYMYVGTKKADGNFLQRNGLADGKLYFWKANTAGVTNVNGIEAGATQAGKWVEIAARDATKAGQAGYDTNGYKLGNTLRDEVFAANGWLGYRIEDMDFNPVSGKGNQVAFNTTGGDIKDGRAGNDQFGSIWTIDVAFNGGIPATATLKHLYDGDAAVNQQNGVRSPDNLAWSGDGNIYVNEDKSTTWSGSEASVWKVNATSGAAERMLVMNRAAVPAGQTDGLAGKLGEWESSGIIDVSSLYGNKPGTDFFLNVQAHGVKGGEIDKQNLVEGGQLLAASTRPKSPAPLMMTGVAQGASTKAIYTIGQAVAGFSATGVPDGQGAYLFDQNTIRILFNSEIGNTAGYDYLLANGTQLTGARIQYLDINKADGTLVRGGLAYDTVYDRAGKVVTSESQVRGPGVTAGGFNRFCSANLVEKDTFGTGKGAADRMFLLGEEFTDGTMWILDVDQGDLWAAPAMGYGSWETATMVDTGNTSQVAYLLGDDGPGEKGAAIYMYVGTKKADGNFLQRNGLADGKLYFWKANTAGVTNVNGIEAGATQAGKWVEIAARDATKAGQAGYDTNGYKLGNTLRDEVFAANGWLGYRIEDMDFNPVSGKGNQVAFNTTGGDIKDGRAGNDQFGSIWTIDVAFNGGIPATATLKHLYDGDAAVNQQNGVRSPDNLAWSGDGNIYVNEDKSTTWSGSEASVWKVNATSGAAERMLVMNRAAVPAGQTDGLAGKLGEWESSGIIDVSSLYGNKPGTDFFLNVQAHGVKGGEIDKQNLVEGGQLIRWSNVAPDAAAKTVSQFQSDASKDFVFNLAPLGAIPAKAQTSRSADYNSDVWLYRVADAQGSVLDPVTGNLIRPDEASYVAAVEANKVSGVKFSRKDGEADSQSLVVQGDGYLLGLVATVANTGQTFYSFAAANADGYSHFKYLSANKVGFEDQFSGGDKDHNDLIIDLTFTA